MALNLNVEIRGEPSAPAVILIHGLLGVGRNLWRLSEGLVKAGFRTVVYDQRGHGRSPWADDYRIEVLAQDALRLLSDLSIENAHFVGHSMGGRVALAATGLAASRVRSLSMLDVGPSITQGALDEIHRIMDPLPDYFESKSQTVEFLAGFPPAIAQFLQMNLKKTGPEHNTEGSPELHWAFDLKGLRRFLGHGLQLDQSETLKSWKGPALMLRGEKSRYMTLADTDRAQALKPDLQVEVISGAHHWLHVENLHDTLHRVLEFLKTHP